ncbi:MAG: DUF3857 domain-containing transglutaminase family protein [Rhodothermales bacterium]|nr:DUF3857 domain-containing transglutaminase family protein [Rhodothermales bacterium]
MPRTRFIFLLIPFLLAAYANAQDAPFRISAAPAWVEMAPLPAPDPVPTDEISDGLYYLRIDEQHRVEGRSVDFFSRTAYAVVNTQGIQNGSQLAIDFDPTYQALTLHFVRIHRNGVILDRLDPADVRILQRETELEYQIYDGTLTASIILEDIQTNDLIEYAFTLAGDNPIFEGTYASGFNARLDIPVKELTYRLIWPADRTLNIRSYGVEVEPEISLLDGAREYRWRFTDVPALVPDDQLPYWYNPFPWVQVSEWESWQAVAAWGRLLFDRVDHPSDQLKQEVDRIRAGHATPKERLAAALRFTQDEIRYMGIEIGVNSHEPRSPAEVLQKRFGDCKDKSLLLVAMLRELGIEAHPVLVNTIDAREMDRWLPAAGLFDHAIVRATLDDTVYWFDPTSSLQRGTADAIHQPDYDQALVLEPGANALTWMYPPVVGLPLSEIEEEIDLRNGLDAPAAYTITSTYRSENADYMRGVFAGSSRQELEKNYLNYYAEMYPHISSAGVLEIEDDEATNVLRVKEYYRIDSLWTREGRRSSAYFYPLEFSALLEKPSTRIRTMPIGIAHPVHLNQTTRIHLPEPWPVESTVTSVEDPAFSYQGVVSSGHQIVTIANSYRTNTDFISVEAIPAYIDNVERVENQLGYELYREASILETDFPWPISLVGLAALLGLVLFFMRRKKTPAPNSAPPSGL